MYWSQQNSLAAAHSLLFLLLQVTLESVPVLQVMREFVSSTISHVHASERAMKLKVKSLSL